MKKTSTKTRGVIGFGKLLGLLLLAFLTTGVFAQTPAFYTGNVNSPGNSFPFGSSTGGKSMQSLIAPGEFTGAFFGNITKFYVQGTASNTSTYTMTIRMGQTTATTLPTGALYTGAMTTVYSVTSATLTSTAAGWLMMTLNSPFLYDPTKSLVVEINCCVSGNFLVTNVPRSGYRRTWNSAGCPVTYSSQDANLFNCGVDISSAGGNDAGVLSIDSPTTYCTPGSMPVYATIKNFGTNQVTSVNVNWSVNGVAQTGTSYTSTLDTFGGSGPQTAQLNLGNYTFGTGVANVKVWTSSPNGVLDTVRLNDTVVVAKQPSMGGTYTINPSGTGTTNFTSFAAAVTALQAGGVCAPVTFLVSPATYTVTSAISFPATIVGVNNVNTITFEGTSAASRIVTGNLASTGIFVFNGSSYITLRNLTINNTSTSAVGVGIVGQCKQIRVNNCVVNIPVQTGTSTTGYCISITGSAGGYGLTTQSSDSIYIDSNIVNGGGYGLCCYGSSSTTANRDLKFRYNTANNINGYGAYIAYNYNAIDFIGNTINMTAQNYGYMGLYFYYNQSSNTTVSTQIIGNKIMNFGYYGVYMYYPQASAASAKFKFYNNIISGGNGSTYYGYYGWLYYSNAGCVAEMLHNTIVMNGAGQASASSYGLYASGTTAFTVKNNIFAVTAGAYTPAYFATSPSAGLVNYNNYYNYTNPTTGILLYRGANYTPANYHTAAAGGDSSFNVRPSFVAISPIPGQNLHLTDGCGGYGVDLTASVPTDVDGDLRSTTPNVGADEFTGAVADNLMAFNLLTPVAPITLGSQDLSLIVKNVGNNTVSSYDVAYKLNTGSPVIQAYTGAGLAPCGVDTMVFTGSNQITLGSTNNIKVYTRLPNGNPDADRTNDSISKVLYAPMSGNYTIGGTAPDFPTFQAAADALIQYGVSGPVNFDVRAATYTITAPITIGNVLGASATNLITFEGNNAATRIITGSLATNAMVVFNGAKYITFRNITVTNTNASSVGICINGTANKITINRCVINVPVQTSTGSAGYGISVTGTGGGYGLAAITCDSICIDTNIINGGGYGLLMYGASNSASNRDYKIRGNVFNNTNYYGMYVAYNYNAIDVLGNTWNMTGNPNYAYMGMYFYYNQNSNINAGHNIIKNKVLNFGGYGIYCYYSMQTATAGRTKIHNNTISSQNGASYPGYYGLYLYQGVSNAVAEVYHNTITMNGPGTSNTYTAFYNTTGTNNIVKNNIFAVYAGIATPVYLATSLSGNIMNYNIYYNATDPVNGNLIYRGVFYTPANYHTASAGGDSSYNVAPPFVSSALPGNYHLTHGCSGYGVDLTSSVPTDIDGDVRSTTPNPGSDEFTGGSGENLYVAKLVSPAAPITLGTQDLRFVVVNIGGNTVTSFNASYKLNTSAPVTQGWSGTMATCGNDTITFTGSNQVTLSSINNLKVFTDSPNGNTDLDKTNDTISVSLYAPMHGTYTIGGVTPDFANFTLAANALNQSGIDGPVSFDVRAGTYSVTAPITLGNVTGANSVNTITFEGNNAATRIITSSLPNTAPVLFNGAKYITFRNITVTNTNASAVGICMNGSCNKLTIVNCVINVPYQTSTNSSCYGISVTGTAGGYGSAAISADSIVIDSNIINGGGYGVHMYGSSNTTSNRDYKVRYNTLNGTNYYGFYIAYNYNSIDIIGNTLNLSGNPNYGYMGMYFYYNQTTNTAAGHKIIGNKVTGFGGYGIYCYYPQQTVTAGNTKIYNNVIASQTGSSYPGYYGLYLYQGSSTAVAEVLHNTIAMVGPGTSTTYSAFYNAGGSNNIVKNNIFSVYAGSATPAYISAALTGNILNYNDYYNATNTTTGSLVYRNAVFYTPSNYKTAANGGDSSFNADPSFVNLAANNYNVRTCYTGVDYTTLVPTDINGTLRNVPPKIGAYENPPVLVYSSSSVVQQTGFVAPGSTDIPVLKIPVVVSGCGLDYLTEIRFNTSGTSAPANILSAKLYKTGTSGNFNNTNLVGTVFSPSGAFSFIVNDSVTRTTGDTINYWLAYDVSSGAPNLATLDARVDSMQIFGNWKTPTNNNPTGNLVISSPMTYAGSDAMHPDLSQVEQGSVNNLMLRIVVVGSATGSPINVTNFSLSTNGSSSATTNIAGAKIWYTGTSNAFATSQQFGTTVASPSGTYNISGSQPITNGINYFWLTYNTPATAIIGDSVDAEINTITVGGTPQTPTTTAPAGNRKIRAPYCQPTYASGCGTDYIARVRLGSLDNSTGCGGQYTYYSTGVAVPTISKGGTYTLTLDYGSDPNQYAMAWIDYNSNGTFETTESLPLQIPNNAGGSGTSVITFTVPSTANTGVLRMRVRGGDDVQPASNQPCGASNSGWGEGEDYQVNVVQGTAVYVWNGTVSSDVTVPGNWTPARTAPAITDKILFNLGGTINVTNVPTSQSGVIEVSNATILNIGGTSVVTVTASDSLIIGTNSRLNTGSATIALGTSPTQIGAFSGNGVVNGNLMRYMSALNPSISFPLGDNTGKIRTATVNYTTIPGTLGPVTASFISSVPGNGGLPLTQGAITVKRAGLDGYWNIASTMTGGVYNGVFNGNGFGGVANYTGLVLLNRANSAASWILHGTHVTTTGSNAAPVLSRTGMTNYGQFAIGGDTLVNPLPVSMLFFNARSVNGNVLLNWATASELNNKGFMVTRSTDGVNFEDVMFVDGKGTSKVTTVYNSEDKEAFVKAGAATLYYRLRQVDMDGNETFSSIATVNKNDQLGDDVKIFPNPFVSHTGLSIESVSATPVQIEVLDMQGKQLSTESITVKAGSNYHDLKTLANMANGIYFVKVSMNGLTKTTKVTKTN